jgi:hypothetical protein
VAEGLAVATIPCPTNPDPIGLEGAFRTFSGSAWNFDMQPPQQKEYFFPWYSVENRAVAGSTFIPQTGSVSAAGLDVPFSWSMTDDQIGQLAKVNIY